MTYQMVRNADVVLHKVLTDKGNVARIEINGGKFEHTFPPESRVSKELQLTLPKDLGARLNGGNFFFVDDQLVDYRGHEYVAHEQFCHTDESIDALMATLGYRHLESRADKITHRFQNRTASRDLALSKIWSDHPIDIPEFKEGGVFSSRLNFIWNPFEKNVNSIFELIREICSNGMVGTTPFCNMKVPLVNRWEEHIEITNAQIQNKVYTMLDLRLRDMAQSRASVHVVDLLDRHINERLLSRQNMESLERLVHMRDIVDPAKHLAGYYKGDVFESKAIAAQLPSHLSTMDAWNIATELCSHYSPAKNSTDSALQKMANQLVFDAKCSLDSVAKIGSSIELSPYSSPAKAFFGEVSLPTY